ncbi:MAG: ABC transporter ATP-binding protein [Erysipelotrichaceae bacterium]
MNQVLKVEQVDKVYVSAGLSQKALNRISLEVEKGEFVGIMGPSGSGKTTLLNCISTIDTITAGKIIIGGQNITELKKEKLHQFRSQQLGFIFQDFNLLDRLSAKENISLPLSIQRQDPALIEQRVHDIAKKLEIEELLHKFPYQLSGGQKQRVAAARAMVTQPTLVLADEPTGALDSKAARLLLERLEHLNQTLHTTILMVTHDAFSASYAKRILFIKDGRVFNELVRGEESRKDFFKRILEVVSVLGGDTHNVF